MQPEVLAPHLNYLQLPCRCEEPRDSLGDIVLIHGLAANAAFWYLGVGLPLSQLLDVTIYELRGHGRSDMPQSGYRVADMADDLARLLDRLGLDRVHLLAHSFGGAVAMRFTVTHPERVRSLVLADCRLRSLQPQQRLVDWSHWPQWDRLLRRVGIRIDPQDPDGGYHLLVEMARLQEEHPQLAAQLPRLFSAARDGKLGRKGSRVARRWLELQQKTTIREDFKAGDAIEPAQLERLRVPILGVYGEHSNALPTARALRRLCPTFQLRVLKNAGHFFPISQPNRMVRATLRFLERQADERGAAVGHTYEQQ